MAADKLIIAGTGHRPDKLGGYGKEQDDRLEEFAVQCLQQFKPDIVISGFALGWDMALAAAAIELKLPLYAYIPFDGQESRWPVASQERWRVLTAAAAKIVVVSTGAYAVWKMQARNEAMVKDCTKLLALWNGTTGGTANCVKYAEKVKRPMRNVWPEWERWCARA